MNKLILFVFVVGLWMAVSPSKAQDPFSPGAHTFRFDPTKKSNYLLKDDQLKLNLYDAQAGRSGKFTIPVNLLYRYIYTDTASVIGQLDPLIMARPQDFAYLSDICFKAQEDCKLHYKMWQGAAIGTLFFTILSPVASLSVAVPTSLTPPRIENLGLSDVDMLQEGLYFHTYRKEAARLKSKRIWTAYGIGFGIHVGILFGILSAFN
ncbi:MAG: hypothetical protein K2L50_00510 [Bacteroidales bacterium]|nr:hypothetical protein [Bacteroidales bacterium]